MSGSLATVNRFANPSGFWLLIEASIFVIICLLVLWPQNERNGSLEEDERLARGILKGKRITANIAVLVALIILVLFYKS
ncbi:hypothetical protein HY546_00935 [archaeon]|nr:hypothetical protein [archaeon]